MSKRAATDFDDTPILVKSNVEGGDDEEEVFEGSELDSAADETPAAGG